MPPKRQAERGTVAAERNSRGLNCLSAISFHRGSKGAYNADKPVKSSVFSE